MCMCRCAVHGLWGGPGKEPGEGGVRGGGGRGVGGGGGPVAYVPNLIYRLNLKIVQ